jgi:hypothetical protein
MTAAELSTGVEMDADTTSADVSSFVADDMAVDPVEIPRLHSPPVRAVAPPLSPLNSDPGLSDEEPQPQLASSSAVPLPSRRNPVRQQQSKPEGLPKYFPARKDFA